MKEKEVSRRRFLNYLLGFTGIGLVSSVFYPISKYLLPPENVEASVNSLKAGMVDDFKPNSSKIIKFGRKPVLLIRTASGSFLAFSAICTHLDCIIQFDNEKNQIVCACHNGLYDLKGRNISGPPPKPLKEFEVKILNNEVTIIA